MKINDIVKVEGAKVAEFNKFEKFAVVVIAGGSEQYPCKIPIKFLGKVFQDMPEIKEGDIVDIDLRLGGSENKGYLNAQLTAASVKVVSSSKSVRDYAAQLNACKDLPQLQSVWMSIPSADKPKFETAKNLKKEALSDPSFGDDDDNDDLPF